MRVLIADDDNTSRRILQASLRKLDYEVTAVATGDEALAILQGTGAPRLAILDWMMPGLDGVEICRRLQQASSSVGPTYVILLTGRSETADIVEALRAGANDYITKPFDQEELRARLATGRQVVELREALEQERARNHALLGLIAICTHCHRAHAGSTPALEAYLEAHPEPGFRSGPCPDCQAREAACSRRGAVEGQAGPSR